MKFSLFALSCLVAVNAIDIASLSQSGQAMELSQSGQAMELMQAADTPKNFVGDSNETTRALRE